jgi:hypothetical protein
LSEACKLKKNKNTKGFVAEKQHRRNSYSFFLPVKRGVAPLKYLSITFGGGHAYESIG